MIRNELYPIFLKASQLNILIVGGGAVAYEKLAFMLKSSPNARVKLIAPDFSDDVLLLSSLYKVELIKEEYNISVLVNQNMVIAATNNKRVNVQVYNDCKSANILINVADTPDYCDFYLGGIVTKGHVKVAISTNGKSPTTAKRLRQFFEEVIPKDISDLVENLNKYRSEIGGDFSNKVTRLNELTKSIISK
ncbi:MAG: bifunctional precorrin-2 dehydrogenase/sirohydrochlorin ferrochelatase [Crocinitomicaceae bacterium]|nr:bifunctional precorrin-2 dehydrogenase/sirohydrochlorin ferrochelatase [Crocinitomicaceae bacterium]